MKFFRCASDVMVIIKSPFILEIEIEIFTDKII